LLCIAFGALILSGKTVREVIDGAAGYLGLGVGHAAYADDAAPWDDVDDEFDDEDEPRPAPRGRGRGRGADDQATEVLDSPTGYSPDPYDNYPP
ncbi:cell division protein FtsK, partial [Streptomyces sp. SID10244]|nr:cell division protein FtsK [Streptomyces sp. SID10244]